MDRVKEETDDEKWERFRKNCPKNSHGICWSKDLFACKLENKNRCDLWYVVNFK